MVIGVLVMRVIDYPNGLNSSKVIVDPFLLGIKQNICYFLILSKTPPFYIKIFAIVLFFKNP